MYNVSVLENLLSALCALSVHQSAMLTCFVRQTTLMAITQHFIYVCLGVDIGFQHSQYDVNEDAGQVVVCATIQHAVEMESGKSLSVTFSTASGCMFYSC